jgi:hypothetical protein
MKIKSLGYLSFSMSFDNVDVLTDPFSLDEVGLKLPKTKADVVLHTDFVTDEQLSDVEQKITPASKEDVLHIRTPGEYELGGLMVRRNIKDNFYILDEDFLRVLYVGSLPKDTKSDVFKDLGDVEVLIIPVGDGENFPEFSVIEKIVSIVDPLLLIPSGFRTPCMKSEKDLKTVDDFVKQSGYTNVQREKSVKITGAPEKEVRKMDVVILE